MVVRSLDYRDTKIRAEGRDGAGTVSSYHYRRWLLGFWDNDQQEFIPSEFSAIGDDGHSPLKTAWSLLDTTNKSQGRDGVEL